MIKNPLRDYLTKDERKILSFVGIVLLFGMIIHYSGNSLVHAEKTGKQKQDLRQAVAKDTIITIDIRTAGAQELELLPGIGAKKALAIIEYRESKQFDSPEEIMNISGIGARTYLKMKPMLLPFGTHGAGVIDNRKLQEIEADEVFTDKGSVSIEKQELDVTANIPKKEHNTKKLNSQDKEYIVNLNTASKADIMSLSGIGDKKADAILAYRKEIGRYTSLEQLLDVKGIGVKTLEKNRHRLSL